MHKAFGLLLAGLLMAALPAGARHDRPSRAPVKNCAWEKLADTAVGLSAWVQHCNYGFRKIDFLFAGNALAIRYSDGGAPDPVIEILDLLPGETPQAGVKRVFAAHTEPVLAARCTLASYRGGTSPAGAKRYTFVPKAVYQKELDAKANPNEVGDPPCGEWGDAPDGIQYFEVHPFSKARKILFVRVGQDEPLFDEKTLQLIGPAEKVRPR